MTSETSTAKFRMTKTVRKVKTGCITCRIRRVKCDERKPSCARCTNTGRKCDGYARAEQASSGKILDLAVPALPSLGKASAYLEFYYHSATQTLSSRFDNKFWSQTALQMAHSEQSIRHALIALGCLSKSSTGSIREVYSKPESSEEFYSYYGRALKALATRMEEPSCTSEISLAACLIFICIDFLRGDRLAATIHLHSGLKLISELRYDSISGLSSPALSRTSLTKSPQWFSKPNTVLNDAIIPIFRRLVTPALLFGIPARDIVDLSITYMGTSDEPTFDQLKIQNDRLRNAAISFTLSMSQKATNGEPFTEEDHKMQRLLLERQDAWLNAIEKFESEHQLSEGDLFIASSHKISYYSTYIQVSCTMDFHQMNYDLHINKFKAIIHHARIILKTKGISALSSTVPTTQHPVETSVKSEPAATKPTAHFTFEFSIIPALSFTASRCRCPTTRREALSLLATKPPRECLWDAEVQLALGSRMVQIEEQHLDAETGWPLARHRLLGARNDGKFDSHGKLLVEFFYVGWWEETLARVGDARRTPGLQWEELV